MAQCYQGEKTHLTFPEGNESGKDYNHSQIKITIKTAQFAKIYKICAAC
ncbi:hypothetical protein F542_12560 [Bibersteinia trehalosi USDA-ARS-USMARC-188]|uniref:Uncharacterized protein n=2 Tax=Bibersteinia trehalosi TaxID=47735 RepID=A0A4V7I851_BIBTR|nr:hypothetical protein WQG_9480 [Bibersteinia trehalosi USDA-ARS-USMARC-192]AHG81176.1 hypothetical protein F542_4580 [Bibersteinia trehalosi USDA-ARS-USMARC-188]AHG83388.1 hypothetical protein F543_5240 [Bibersteinia trehalosi USDA-ARS-USMARC-189]AGH39077.1 hypothetical protein WQG_18000 [Bibersteinia trehalosi USDA-ARS-USMARC-192]AHG81974.1 hypothetical protein F542_12560 [Bibersteinia trehalosi USDA-ARS-USMARC-188]